MNFFGVYLLSHSERDTVVGCVHHFEAWKKFPLTEFESNFINLALDTKTSVSLHLILAFGLVEKLLRVEMPS